MHSLEYFNNYCEEENKKFNVEITSGYERIVDICR